MRNLPRWSIINGTQNSAFLCIPTLTWFNLVFTFRIKMVMQVGHDITCESAMHTVGLGGSDLPKLYLTLTNATPNGTLFWTVWILNYWLSCCLLIPRLICSDAMARGMDIDNVRFVISYGLPPYLKTYIHRVGRTARAGKPGIAFSLLQKSEVRYFHDY